LQQRNETALQRKLTKIFAAKILSILFLVFAVTSSSQALAATSAETYYKKGMFSLKQRHHEEALLCFNRALSVEPNYVPALVQRAELYLLLEQYSKAQKDCQKTLSLKTVPDKLVAKAHKILADCHIENGNYRQADQELDQVIALDCTQSGYFMCRGDVSKVLNKNDQAIKDFSAAITLQHGQSFKAHWSRGDVYVRLGRHSEAVKDYTTAIAQNPKRADRIYVCRAQAYIKLAMYQKSVDDCSLALLHLGRSNAAQRQDYSALNLRASAYEKLGKKALAEKDRQAMRRIDDFEI